jgi:hypothetical protein
MSGCEDDFASSQDVATPQLSESPEQQLDWSNPHAIWSTPLSKLRPPPSGPLLPPRSSSPSNPEISWEASLPFRAPMYPSLPEPTFEIVESWGGDDTHDLHAAEEKTNPTNNLIIKAGTHTPPPTVHASPLTTQSPWSSYASTGISASPRSTIDSYSRPGTTYTESPASTFDSQRKVRHSSEEEPHSNDPYYKAVFVTDRSEGAIVHVLRGQTWQQEDKLTGKNWRRHQRIIEGSITMKVEEKSDDEMNE